MRRVFAVLIGTIVYLGGFAEYKANAADALRLDGTSAWRMEYSDDSCRLARLFGEGRDATVLSLERFGPGNAFQLLIAGRSIGGGRQASGYDFPVTIQFGPTEAPQQIEMTPASLGELPAVLKARVAIAPDLEPGDMSLLASVTRPERERTVTIFRIRGTGIRETVLNTGPMDKPFEAMRACIDELVQHWGIDLERHKTLSRPATPDADINTWMNTADYPLMLLNDYRQGLVMFRLMVGPDGKPVSCHIQRSTRPKAFDDAVCKSLMKRAQFKPALDASGQALTSYYRSFVKFEIGRQ